MYILLSIFPLWHVFILYQDFEPTASGMEPPTEDQNMQLKQMPHDTGKSGQIGNIQSISQLPGCPDFVYPQGQFNVAPPQQVLGFDLDNFNYPAGMHNFFIAFCH